MSTADRAASSDAAGTTDTAAVLDADRARAWLERWDRQQEHYLPRREDRFTAMLDTLEVALDRPDPLVVDLGIGPGSLSTRLMDRFPGASVIGVDADPLLLGLCRLAHEGRPLRLVRTDLRRAGWSDRLRLDRPVDAFVSTTALHWMDAAPLGALMAECATVLAPGGLFVDGDHLYEGATSPALEQLNRALAAVDARRAGVTAHEDWGDWWRAVEQAPELADLVAERAGGFDHTVTDKPTVADYLRLLLEAGFSASGTVWQYGDDRVVVGLR